MKGQWEVEIASSRQVCFVWWRMETSLQRGKKGIEFHFPSTENDVLFKNGFSSLCVGNIRRTRLAAGILFCACP
jgi:hypothetical protein